MLGLSQAIVNLNCTPRGSGVRSMLSPLTSPRTTSEICSILSSIDASRERAWVDT